MVKPLKIVCDILMMVPITVIGQDKADAFPTKPVRLIVPYAAGGSNDIVARVLGQKLSERWKQQVIIDNRGGANGVIASLPPNLLPTDTPCFSAMLA